MSDAQHPRQRPRRTHAQRTAIVFFGLTVEESLEVAVDRVRDVAVVAQAWLGCATLPHPPGCLGTGRLTRHHHYTRTARRDQAGLYERPIWQVRCLDCQAVFTVRPSFLLRDQRFDADWAQHLCELTLVMTVSSRHANILLSYGAPTAFAPAVYWRLLRWLGTRLPVTRVWRRLGLTPPRSIITEEKFTPEAGHRTYVPAMVQQELLWAIDSVEQTAEETLRACYRAFLREVQAVDPDDRRRGALQDGWQPAHKARQAVCPQVVLGECHLHAQRRMAQVLVEYHAPHPEVSPPEWPALQAPHDQVLAAPRLFPFAQRLRRLPEGFRADPVLQRRDASLPRQKPRFTAGTTKPLPKATTALDQLFKWLDRQLFSMPTLQEGVSARATANAWAIVGNFGRDLPGAKRAGQSPVELAGADLKGVP
jgi:hypothetical protein